METKRQKYLAHVGATMSESKRLQVREALIELSAAASRAARNNGNESYREGLESLSDSIRRDMDALVWYEADAARTALA